MNDLVPSGIHDATPAELEEAALRPTGKQRFDALTVEEQDALIGAEAAQMIRDGEATLADFVQRTSPGDTPGFIRQKPVEDL
jgi:hypothetical protein